MVAGSLWAAALMRISLKSFQAERWDDSLLFFFLSFLLWRALMERASLWASGELRVGMSASPVTVERRFNLPLHHQRRAFYFYFFYGCHLVEEGGLHWWQTGLLGCFLSLSHQSLMIPPYTPTCTGHPTLLPRVHQKIKNFKRKWIFRLVSSCYHQTLV